MNYYIYLDDVRENDRWFRQNLNSENWTPCITRSYEETIAFLSQIQNYRNNDEIIILDLDHDLGETEEGYDEFAYTGYDVCKWVIENHIQNLYFHIHSMNAIGSFNMRQLLTNYGYNEI